MFNSAEVKALAAQKQLLVAESELNRHTLSNELARLRAKVEHLHPGRSALLLLAPLAGFAIASRGKSWKGWLKKLALAWKIFLAVKRLTTAFSRHIPGTEESQPPADAPTPKE